MVPSRIKRMFAATILALLVISVGLLSGVSAASVKQESLQVFLRDVVGLDMTKFQITTLNEDDISGTFRYNITNDDMAIRVLCNFKGDNSLSWFHLYTSAGPQVPLTHSFVSILDAARSAIDRYQNYSKAPYISDLKETLGMVSDLKVDSIAADDYSTLKVVASASIGNTTLTVFSGTESNSMVQFDWMNKVNGIRNQYNKVGFTFSPYGILQSFTDTWNYYPVGSADVRLSREEAIGLAEERLTAFSYDVGSLKIGYLTTAKDFPARAEVSMQPRNEVLYPHWEIYLPLDRVYLGNVVSVRVMMWDDTGEVDSIHASSTLGNVEDEGEATPTPTPTPTQTSAQISTDCPNPTSSVSQPAQKPQATETPNFFDLGLVVAVVVAVFCVGIALVLMRRKKTTLTLN